MARMGRDQMKVARVFPRRTKASPTDGMAFFDAPDMFPIECDEVRVSVAFTYDMQRAEQLANAWKHVAPVKIGGPATGARGDAFEPGMYLREGYTITSRGCPNKCWFCSVPKREGALRELPIRPGWNVLDDNLLATSDEHFMGVVRMLLKQERRPEFTGGLEAARLTTRRAGTLFRVHPKRMYFAYDTPDDYEPLVCAAKLLWQVGFTPQSHVVSAYVLIGHPKDTMEAADKRLRQVLDLGIVPMAMHYRDTDGERDPEWARFQRTWARPTMVCAHAEGRA
jgi:hypothetical protein